MHRTLLAALLLLGLGVPGRPDEEPEIRVDIGQGRAYVGQPRDCQVTIRNLENAPTPEFEPSKDFDLEPLGGPMDLRASAAAPGRPAGAAERVYRYRLIPRKSGPITIPAPKVRYGGAVLLGPERVIEVWPEEQQDVVFLTIHTDRGTLYPTQQFKAMLTVAVRELPEPYQDQDPTDLPTDEKPVPPRLRIPWIDNRQIPAGLTPCVAWEDWLEPLRSKRKGGFRINSLGEHSVQTLFQNRTVTFRPEPRRVVRPDKNGIEKHYWQYEFSRQFIAQEVGQYSFGPVTLEGKFATALDAQKRLVPEAVFASADPVQIIVRQIPQQGRPETYIGAVGRFQLDAQLTPQRAKVGDPMTLELRLYGTGNLDDVAPANLQAAPAITERFRIYEATQKSGPDEVRFLYRLRPLQAGIDQFPTVGVAYFDTAREEYVVLRTAPVPIQVLPADRLSGNQIVTLPSSLKQADTGSVAQRAGVFANITDLSSMQDESVGLLPWVAALGGAAGVYMGVAVLTLQIRRRKSTALVRSRAAAGRARRCLRQARLELAAGRTCQAADLVSTAVSGLVADKLDLFQPALTRNDVRNRLLELGVEQAMIDEIVPMLDACDAVRFGGCEESFTALAEKLDGAMTRLIQSFPKES